MFYWIVILRTNRIDWYNRITTVLYTIYNILCHRCAWNRSQVTSNRGLNTVSQCLCFAVVCLHRIVLVAIVVLLHTLWCSLLWSYCLLIYDDVKWVIMGYLWAYPLPLVLYISRECANIYQLSRYRVHMSLIFML